MTFITYLAIIIAILLIILIIAGATTIKEQQEEIIEFKEVYQKESDKYIELNMDYTELLCNASNMAVKIIDLKNERTKLKQQRYYARDRIESLEDEIVTLTWNKKRKSWNKFKD